MSQKSQALNFLAFLEKGAHTKKEAIQLFVNSNPEANVNNFKFYINAAIKSGEWTPKVEEVTSSILGLPAIKESNVVPFKVTTVDPTILRDENFKAFKTGTAVDRIASKRDGVMPGCVYVVPGESGAGKTTVCVNIATYLKRNNPGFTAGFISAEMVLEDWTDEVYDNKDLADLETIFMLDYLDADNYLDVLVQALSTWNFIVLDSFEVILDQIKEIKGWTGKKAEAYLINILRQAADESRCTIFAIQHFTKGGTYAGSSKLKHMLTGMLYVRFDEGGERYIEFAKNRRAGHMVNKRLYFTKCKETGKLLFDGNKFEMHEAQREFSVSEVSKIKEEENEFDALLEQVKLRETETSVLVEA